MYKGLEKYLTIVLTREKGRDLTQSYDRNPSPTEKSKKQRHNTKTPPKIRLHNDCGPT